MTSNIPPKGEPTDFRVISEGWSSYEIKDKLPVKLKARLILSKLIRTNAKDEFGNTAYAPGTPNPIFVTFAPKELRQEPTMPPPTPDQIEKAQKFDLQFVVKDEPWNEYQLDDGTIVRTKISVTGVLKTPFFALDGDPIYIFSHSAAGRAIPKNVVTS